MKLKYDKNKDRIRAYLRFSNVGIQMAVIITAGALGGRWLDQKQENDFPIWTLVLVLIAIFAALYQVIRVVIKMGKEKKDDDQ